MRMVVGLGNPGRKYESSRHNLGFQVIDRAAERLSLAGWKSQFEAQVARGHCNAGSFLLVKPQTFVNLSGRSVAAVVNYFQIEPSDRLVVVDDLDLDVGRIRIRSEGGHGGHNGLRSVIDHLGGGDFKRVRIGIGRPPEGATVTGHVLGASPKEEEEKLSRAREEVVGLVIRFIAAGLLENWTSN